MSYKPKEGIHIKIGPYEFTAATRLDSRGQVLLIPVSANGNDVHFHVFEENGIHNVLIRNQYNQNTSAYVYSGGQWVERPLTEQEKRRRLTDEEKRLSGLR